MKPKLSRPARNDYAPAQANKKTKSKLEKRITDKARFIRSWFGSPGKTGAVSPSGPFLARAMAQCVDPAKPGLVIELGPGTGPVTEALTAHGVHPRRLVLVEFDPGFCRLLRERYPDAHVIQGDAYNLSRTLDGLIAGPIAAVVSSLPLLNRPEAERLALLAEAFKLMGGDGLFAQFTYGVSSPMPISSRPRFAQAFRAQASHPVWLNLPPARVWRYTRSDSNIAPLELHAPQKKLKNPVRIFRHIVEGVRENRL